MFAMLLITCLHGSWSQIPSFSQLSHITLFCTPTVIRSKESNTEGEKEASQCFKIIFTLAPYHYSKGRQFIAIETCSRIETQIVFMTLNLRG